jgi:hypothetical protein
MRGERFGAVRVPFPQLEARTLQGSRQPRLLEQRAGGGEKNPYFTAPDSLERFDPLAGNLRVRLSFSKALAGRVKGDGARIVQRLEIRQPALGAGHPFSDNYEKSALTGARKSGNGDCVAGTWETGCV